MRRALLSVLFGLAAATAGARQPFFTDDAEVAKPGVVHLEIFNEFERLPPALELHRQQNTFNMRATYGLGDSWN